MTPWISSSVNVLKRVGVVRLVSCESSSICFGSKERDFQSCFSIFEDGLKVGVFFFGVLMFGRMSCAQVTTRAPILSRLFGPWLNGWWIGPGTA